jgi:hypothetical protein
VANGHSRRKGKEGEREVVRRFVSAGIPCRRAWENQSLPGGQLTGDLDFLDAIKYGAIAHEPYAEVRRRKKALDIPAWLREIEECANDHRRALIFRRDSEDWHVAIPLDYYIELLGGKP